MRIAFLGNPESWYFHDLKRAAQHESLVAVPFSEIRATVGMEPRIWSGEIELNTFDALLVRTMPPGSLEQVVFRMNALARLSAAGVTVLNPPSAIEAAVDKYLTLAKLAAVGLRVPRTVVCQTPDDALEAFAQLGGDIVLKPLFGSEGRGLTRLNDPDLAERAFQMLARLGAVLYVQEFLPHHGWDLRVLVLGDQVWGMRRQNAHDWRTNISRGAQGIAVTPTPAEIQLARTAAQAIGAPFAGVDLLPTQDGELIVLEVNAVPGWRALARVTETDVARAVLDWIQAAHSSA